jgi:hypothetical protein
LKLSGGRPVLASDVLAEKDAFTGIPSEVSARYRIKIRLPQGSKAGARHQIKIRVDQPNLIILAKGSYIEP